MGLTSGIEPGNELSLVAASRPAVYAETYQASYDDAAHNCKHFLIREDLARTIRKSLLRTVRKAVMGSVIRGGGAPRSEFMRHSAVIFIATMVMNAAMFAFHMALSRELQVAEYGTLYSLVAIATFLSVLAGILSTIIARIMAEARDTFTRVSLELAVGMSLKYSAIVGLCTLMILLVLGAPLSSYLDIPNGWPLIALSLVGATQFLLAGARGILQGLESFVPLSVSLALEAAIRTSLAVLFGAVGFGVAGALVAYVIGAVAVIAYSIFQVRRLVMPRFGTLPVPVSGIFKLSMGAALCTLAVAALGTIDVLVVRHYFSGPVSGLYGAISLTGKVAFFAAAFLPTVILPKATTSAARGDAARQVLVPASVSIIAVAGAFLMIYGWFPDFAVAILTGPRYAAAAPYVFRYSIAMSFLGATNAFVAYQIGISDFRFLPFLLLTVAAEAVGLVLFHQSFNVIITVVICTNCAAMLAVLSGSLWPHRPKGAVPMDPVLIAEDLQRV